MTTPSATNIDDVRAQILDGAAVAAQIKLETAKEVEKLWTTHRVRPRDRKSVV